MDELEAKILSYQPTSDAKQLMRDCPLLLLVGSTGSGKDTIVSELMKTGRFERIVSYTTRPPRYNHGVLERDGDDYHFISRSEALSMLNKQQFIEAAYTHGNLYGTSLSEFLKVKSLSKIGTTDIDVKGIRSYRLLSDKVTAVFLLPPSFKVLITRLKARYGDSGNNEEFKVRLSTAINEFNELLVTDYYYALINDNLEETLKRVLDIATGKTKIKSNPEALTLAKKLIKDSQKFLETL